MGTKNNPASCDCYAKAEPDEPMFILLARDKHAPTLVWLWATLRELDQEKPAVVEEARECAAAMIEWAAGRGRQPVGLAQATMAGCFELIRAANQAMDAIRNGKISDTAPTDTEVLRAFLAQTKFEDSGGAAHV